VYQLSSIGWIHLRIFPAFFPIGWLIGIGTWILSQLLKSVVGTQSAFERLDELSISVRIALRAYNYTFKKLGEVISQLLSTWNSKAIWVGTLLKNFNKWIKCWRDSYSVVVGALHGGERQHHPTVPGRLFRRLQLWPQVPGHPAQEDCTTHARLSPQSQPTAGLQEQLSRRLFCLKLNEVLKICCS